MLETKIKDMYKDRTWDKKVTDVIIEFVNGIQKIYGDKYLDRILNRLTELEEIREEFNNSKYQASSKKEYIVFFKEIKDDENFKYVLEHELFHFIQKEGSKFEDVPEKYQEQVSKNIKLFLFEEAFVQYFTAVINNKNPEYTFVDKSEKIKKYWLNECYKDIVGIVEELENKIGKKELFDMYMDDECYENEIKKFDITYGENEFLKYIEEICK
ncbi:MAG: hypothetical protein IKJ32_01685 [Clostridia bacterium]|nr:hypothetical protein [Clostridia bacterium]